MISPRVRFHESADEWKARRRHVIAFTNDRASSTKNDTVAPRKRTTRPAPYAFTPAHSSTRATRRKRKQRLKSFQKNFSVVSRTASTATTSTKMMPHREALLALSDDDVEETHDEDADRYAYVLTHTFV
jgi:hypothetical protein